jgi:hypothetical protein
MIRLAACRDQFRAKRLAMPLADCRCQQADTCRVGQVTDRRIAIGQADIL